MKSKMTRVTISLPSSLVEAADQKLAEEDETRSAMLRRLIESALKEVQEREDVARWVQAYKDQPQTEEEIGWMTELSAQRLGEIPW